MEGYTILELSNFIYIVEVDRITRSEILVRTWTSRIFDLHLIKLYADMRERSQLDEKNRPYEESRILSYKFTIGII